MTATVLIGGDICPTPRDAALFASGDDAALFSDLRPQFQAADLSVANLECPIVANRTPISKSGKILEAPSGTARTLLRSGIRVLNLANNHILDHGPAGVLDTLAECASTGIATFGAGENLAGASKLSIHQAGSLRIGLLGLAEREYCIAGPSSPGAAPIGAMEFVRAIRAAEGLYDRLIVLLHAGKEHVPFPPPALRDLCRFIIEEGASAVLCQHSHCPGWFEDYRGGLIVYGQGNLLFDPWPDPRPWLYDGYLVNLVFDDKGMSYELIPHEQRGDSIGVRLMGADDAAVLLARLRAESAELADAAAYAARWNTFCRERARLYFSIMRGHGRLARKLNAHTGFAKAFYSKSELLDLYNVVRCETHREMLETLLADEVDRTLGNTSY